MKYKTLVADPPWTFKYRPTQGAVPYPTLSTPQLIAMGPQIQDLAATDSHLYLWSTHSHLADALGVIGAWGFRFIQAIPWDKERMGLGHYFRNRTELLLFAVRGHLRLKRRDLVAFIREVRREHSRKPEAAYRLIEAGSPGPRLELFARRCRDGWDAWGNEIQSAISIRVPDQKKEVA